MTKKVIMLDKLHGTPQGNGVIMYTGEQSRINDLIDIVNSHATELAALREEVDGLKGTNQSCGHPCETCDLLGN